MTDSGSTSLRPEETGGSGRSAQGTTGTPIATRSAATATQPSNAASRSEAAQPADAGQAMDPTVTAAVIGLLSATVLLLVIVVIIQAVTRRKASRRCCYCCRFRRAASENEGIGGASSGWQDKAQGCAATRVLGSNGAYHQGEIAAACGHQPSGGSGGGGGGCRDGMCSTSAAAVRSDDAGYGSVSSLPPSRGDACSCQCSARGHGDGGSIDDGSLQPSPQQGTGRRQQSFSRQHTISDTGTIRAAVAQIHSLQHQHKEQAQASPACVGRARAASISMTGNGYWSSSTLPGTTAAASAGSRITARQAHSVGFAGAGSSGGGCCCQHACAAADDCGPAGSGGVQMHRSLFAALRARRNSKIGQVEVAIENDGTAAAGATVTTPQPSGYRTAAGGDAPRQDDIRIDIGKVRSMDEVLLILSRQDMSDRYLGSSSNGCGGVGSVAGSAPHQATPQAAPTSQEIYVFPVPDEPSSDSEQSEGPAEHAGTAAATAADLQLVQQGRYIVLGSSSPGESQL